MTVLVVGSSPIIFLKKSIHQMKSLLECHKYFGKGKNYVKINSFVVISLAPK